MEYAFMRFENHAAFISISNIIPSGGFFVFYNE